MKTSIALIGFMGTGKTAVGQALSKKLNKEFIEMDFLIEQKTGKSISAIFQQDGEIAFRELEIEIAKQVSTKKNVIIACGGGVILNKINIDRLKRESRVVCLTASPVAIQKRVWRDDTRPLLSTPNKALNIQELLRFRKPFYDRAADIKINTSKLDVDSVAEQIIMKTKEAENKARRC